MQFEKIVQVPTYMRVTDVTLDSAVERGGGGGGGGGGGKGVHYPGPRGTKGAPRSLRIIFFFQLCATTLLSSIEH